MDLKCPSAITLNDYCPPLSMFLISPAAGYPRMRGFRGHSPSGRRRPARLPDERGGLCDGSAAVLLRGERWAPTVGAGGAAVWTLAGPPEPRGED